MRELRHALIEQHRRASSHGLSVQGLVEGSIHVDALQEKRARRQGEREGLYQGEREGLYQGEREGLYQGEREAGRVWVRHLDEI